MIRKGVQQVTDFCFLVRDLEVSGPVAGAGIRVYRPYSARAAEVGIPEQNLVCPPLFSRQPLEAFVCG